MMPNLTRLFVAVKPQLAPNQIIGKVKGCLSRVLRQKFPKLQSKLPLLIRSYFVSALRHISNKIVKRCIHGQKTCNYASIQVSANSNKTQAEVVNYHLWFQKTSQLPNYAKPKYRSAKKFASKSCASW